MPLNVNLTPRLEELVRRKVSSGRYNSASEVVREAQRRGPQRVTLHGKDAVVIVGADEFDRLQRPVTGRDIVTVLAASPLAEVKFDRLTVKSRVRNISL